MALLIVILVLVLASAASAAPDLRDARRAGPLTLYPDDARPNLFYYPPGDLVIGTSKSGEPDVHLLHARYTGSASTGDRGTAVIRSIFTVRLLMNGPTPQDLAQARNTLAASIRGAIELRPLPIRRMESAIVYAAAPATTDASDESSETAKTLPSGHFEAAEADAPPRDGYWKERIYTLALGPADAQILSDAFERGRIALSVGYAFLADGIGSGDEPLQHLSGSPQLVAELKKQLATPSAGDDKAAEAKPQLVRAGAVAITVDAVRWPRLVRRVDINESAPPGYAALDVYCYDFNQAETTALYEARVEIEAAGVGGKPVTLAVTFTSAQPDLYARSLRFPVAVRMDRPYRYRVVRVDRDGMPKATAWRERTSWSELLDITSNGEHR